MRPAKYPEEFLLFRRQFVLGPRFVKGHPGWKRVEVTPNLRVTAHPDLPIARAHKDGMSVTLMGYMLDPADPWAADADIIHRLSLHLDSVRSREEFIRLTYPFGGRWILLVDDGREPWLFNDPCGYRQVFYTRDSSQGLWCASQPGLLAEILGLTMDPEALAFIRTFRKRQPEYWWPGDSSPYKEVHHLLPNHYLELRNGTSRRFWPIDVIRPRRLEEVVVESAQLLQRLIESASHRFELALPLTAGKDTRLLLAASKPIRDKLYCFTCQYWDLTRESPDIDIPSRLLTRLGLSHHVIQCPSRMDKKFAQIYQRSVATAHDAYGPIVQGLYEHYPQNKVSMKGCAMPITGSFYRLRLRRQRPASEGEAVDPHALAQVAKMPEEGFALEAFDRWLRDVDEAKVENLDPLTLFLWEDREGNWQAMTQLEGDISREIFVPYNCRLLLANMLSVPESQRTKPTCALHHKLTVSLWPEVLSEPINPPVEPSLVSVARGFLRKPGCMNWRWLGSQIVRNWLPPEATSGAAHDVEAQRAL